MKLRDVGLEADAKNPVIRTRTLGSGGTERPPGLLCAALDALITGFDDARFLGKRGAVTPLSVYVASKR